MKNFIAKAIRWVDEHSELIVAVFMLGTCILNLMIKGMDV